MIAVLANVWSDMLTSQSVYNASMRFAIVLAFAAIGEWVAERGGTLNISLEAMMIGGAYAGAVASDHLPIGLALVVGAAAGALIAALQANLSHRLTIDQFVVGLALNLFVLGLAMFLDSKWSAVTDTFQAGRIPGLSRLPVIGEALFSQPWPMLLIVPLAALAWWLVFRTRWGLELRAVGESPQAADVSGIHVNRRRRQAILFAGACAGLGGAVLVLAQVTISGFDEGLVSLKGIIAIAAVIFGGWTLRGTIFGCLLFGYFFALQINLPRGTINTQLAASLPYVVALGVTALFASRTRQPRALAQPFVRGLV